MNIKAEIPRKEEKIAKKQWTLLSKTHERCLSSKYT